MRIPQPLQRIVAEDPVLAAWDARWRREQALTHAIRNELPRQLAARIHVADAQHTTLEIVADSGAVAAAVRQRLPAVLERLAGNGHEFTGIRVRVQVRIDAGPIPKRPVNPIDSRSAVTLATLADRLPSGPLRASLDRLLKRRR